MGHSAFDQSYDSQAVSWDVRSASVGYNTLAVGHQRTTSDSSVGAAGYANYLGNIWYLRDQWRYSLTEAHALLMGASTVSARADLDLDIKNPRCGTGDRFQVDDCSLSNAPRLQLKDAFTVNLQELYASDRWHVAPQWTLISGLRWSHEDYLDEAFTEPSVAGRLVRSGSTTAAIRIRRYLGPNVARIINPCCLIMMLSTPGAFRPIIGSTYARIVTMHLTPGS